MNKIVFFDTEVSTDSEKILDIGAVRYDGAELHGASLDAFSDFLHGCEYLCGHNIINHDLKYLSKIIPKIEHSRIIDTLYLSPLLFPKKPYHKLIKDDKLSTEEVNNPLNDAMKARDLFYAESEAYSKLDERIRQIYINLLSDSVEFTDFFRFLENAEGSLDTIALIRDRFAGLICMNAPLNKVMTKYPIELAYALAQVSVIKYDSVTPPWVLRNYPRVENILHFLRGKKCRSCPYCDESLDETRALKRYFKFDNFRTYEGQPLQQDAVKAAVAGKSILVVFPTGGGKSITFQLPALMAGANEKGLTIIISPLQSLMKDQTDNLEVQHNITDAVTINSSLDPIERAKVFERVESGSASILYISPESLRSKSIENLLMGRNIVRFVIDEAHCFSAWGQDFRVDYLHIGDFIKKFQEKKDMPQNIPVSCFTATAKQKVVADIIDYFKRKLALELEVFRTNAPRSNLMYHVLPKESGEDKLFTLRQILRDNNCPTIIYLSRTKAVERLATNLTGTGFSALPYHGKMDRQLRVANQEAFMRGETEIMVATTAFGMGVDKKDVGLVIHFDISASLEDYVQEAGRAGRDETINADCYVLFTGDDLDKHFMLLNQTKITQKEIQQIWKAVKDLTSTHFHISQSALEIARAAGWDDSTMDMEGRVKTAINALEESGFVHRGQNMPRIYADSILVKNLMEAIEKINASTRFDDASRQHAVRIMSSLMSAKRKAVSRGDDGEDRIDYISDRLGIVREDVVRVIGLLREEKVLADAKDLVAFIKKGEREHHSKTILTTFWNIENFLFGYMEDGEKTYNIKEMNEYLKEFFLAKESLRQIAESTSLKKLNMILNYYDIKRLVKRTKEYSSNHVTLKPFFPISQIKSKSDKRYAIAKAIIEYLFTLLANTDSDGESGGPAIEFSILELRAIFEHNLYGEKVETDEIEDALFYLLKIGAIKIDGGFLVIYNAMRIERLEKDRKKNYLKEHYEKLDKHYQNKRQQIHIIGEYADRLIKDYDDAMGFVDDYFVMDYDMFLKKYFTGRTEELRRNISPEKYKRLFGELSKAQREIIDDHKSSYIVVAAGPGSGKTKLLTHKLASVYMMEDVKHEQMLMLTFSRAAATEFKLRLRTLIGGAANFIQITTFHSYCFDILGKVGDLGKSNEIINMAIEKINTGEIDLSRITKSVLVIDEAQDMSETEYTLLEALIRENPELRVIAVGDDDQNIYEFRGSKSEFFAKLLTKAEAKKYELLDNYRSNANIVEFANHFVERISMRLKTNPILPIKKEVGTINICKLKSENIAIAVVNAVLETLPPGKTCIITRTNDEALNIAGLLVQNGINARIIQSNNDFNLYNLAEVRDFIGEIESSGNGYAIDDEIWKNAISALNRKYKGSKDLQGTMNLIQAFDELHENKTKYKSDFKQFVRESKLEDFITKAEASVFVSTIHQTKGREFDSVYLALSKLSGLSDEARRTVYVAITRAIQHLHIFCNSDIFDGIHAENILRYSDNSDYPMPPIICVELSHKDVALGLFADHRKAIDSMVSGQELQLLDNGCFHRGKQVLKFSKSFQDRIEKLRATGYVLSKAVIRHIVFWQDKDKKRELKIILPKIEFLQEE